MKLPSTTTFTFAMIYILIVIHSFRVENLSKRIQALEASHTYIGINLNQPTK